MQKVVSNSSILIHLAKIDRLYLLKKFYNKIIIPEAVYKECFIEGNNREDAVLIKKSKWIEVNKIKDTRLARLLYTDLDKGEAEVIVLSIEISADFTLLDDYEARQKARLYGLKITGTLGVLLKAKYKREIKSLKDEIIKLKQTGFRISEQLEYKILKEAGEI